MEIPVIFVVFFFDLFQTVLFIMPSSWCEAEGRSYYSDPQNFVVLLFFLSIKGGANFEPPTSVHKKTRINALNRLVTGSIYQIQPHRVLI